MGSQTLWCGTPVPEARLASATFHMLCVEAAQVANPIELKPGEIWQGLQETYLRCFLRISNGRMNEGRRCFGRDRR